MLFIAEVSDLNVAGGITTPLALTALCLLLGTGVLKLLVRTKPNVMLKMMVNRGFILAMTLGVLANISFVVTSRLNPDVRISGVVRDESDLPLRMAVVDIAEVGRRITDDAGAFEFSIPSSRTVPRYELVTTLAGFITNKIQIDEAQATKTVRIQLKRKELIAGEAIRVPTYMSISHYLGLPQVDVWLNFFNPLPRPMKIEGLALSIISPGGASTLLPLQGAYSTVTGQYIGGPMAAVPVDGEKAQVLGASFFRADDAGMGLLHAAAIEFPITKALPGNGEPIFSEGLAAKLDTYMRKNMVWQAGDWRFLVTATIDGRSFARTFTFSLKQSDVDRMLALGKYYRSGFGVHPNLRLWQLADAGSSVTVTPFDLPPP